jgi:hypothetical protein
VNVFVSEKVRVVEVLEIVMKLTLTVRTIL